MQGNQFGQIFTILGYFFKAQINFGEYVAQKMEQFGLLFSKAFFYIFV